MTATGRCSGVRTRPLSAVPAELCGAVGELTRPLQEKTRPAKELVRPPEGDYVGRPLETDVLIVDLLEVITVTAAEPSGQDDVKAFLHVLELLGFFNLVAGEVALSLLGLVFARPGVLVRGALLVPQ